MRRFFIILLCLAAIVWCVQHYVGQNSPDSFWSSMGSKSADVSTPAPAAGSPGQSPPPITIDTCRAALRTLEEKVLTPLQSKDFSGVEVAQTLQKTQRDLVEFSYDPDYKRLQQACGALRQVMADRQGYSERYQRDAATPAPGDHSPLGNAQLEPATLGGTDSSASFFKDRVATEWSQRCAYYRPALDQLLSGGN